MPFVSFAQNREDVMLYRALKHVEKGFYIDVGANHPVTDSVTKAFYGRGWHGINIEPVPQWFKMLVQERPRDINLQVAASSAAGHFDFYEVLDTVLSTSEPEFARRHTDAGHSVREHKVECRRLDNICDEFGVKEIHFLKIDVEGAEGRVLQGMSFERYRPWIIVIEATEPASQIPNYTDWEHFLIDKYHFVYFDGLNRFYISNEHSELDDSFSIPPNIFDNYITYREYLNNFPFRLIKDRLNYRIRKNLKRYKKFVQKRWARFSTSDSARPAKRKD